VKELEQLWVKYKADCNNRDVLTHEFSQKRGFVSKKLKRAITYTIEGFCVFAKIPRSTFYEAYADKENPDCAPYLDIVACMREECEIDARTKFETGQIPTQLAALWMGHHGYSTIANNRVDGAVPITIIDDIGGNGEN